jgi:hypothetical protein
MMFDTGMSAGAVASQLAARGFQVRTGWGMPQHIRVSTGTMQEMVGFVAALKDILGTGLQENEIGTVRVAGLHGVSPNPMSRQCTIAFSTVGREKAFLTIYDASGRKVRTLVSAQLEAGTHRVTWDGRNVHGTRVASGVYIALLLQGEFAASTKITLVR